MKIYFEMDTYASLTLCPYKIKDKYDIIIHVGSYSCHKQCTFFRSWNIKEKYVECNNFGISIPDELFEI